MEIYKICEQISNQRRHKLFVTSEEKLKCCGAYAAIFIL